MGMVCFAAFGRVDCMTRITVSLTRRELELLVALSSDQLFRREFIDPKMPGYKGDSGEISLGKVLLTRLRNTLDPAAAQKARLTGRAGGNGRT